ncbi:MAG TPA: lysylphosphatidylglycerol synthase transmembrane domain-containing protein [Candidatus Binatia bacterium]|nr:lysylphosphatidylglycerol synthase transmembrane domain-containing protein [Candidatus Binatia bacterium]
MNENQERYLKYGLHAAILAGVVWAVVKYVNGQEVVGALRQFNYSLAPLIVALALGDLLLKAARFGFLLQPYAAELPWITAIKAYVAGQAATILPGGVAARAGLLKQVGVPVSEGSVPVLANSAVNQFFFIVLGLIAALWYPKARLAAGIIVGVLVVAGVVLLVRPSRQWLLNAADWIADRFDVKDQWHNFLDALPDVLTKKIVLVALATTALSFTASIIILRLTLQGLDVTVPYPAVVLAYVLPTMFGRIVPVPAGLGVTEATMTGFLTAASGVSTNTAVAGVVIFRIASIFVPILVGAIVYFLLWDEEEEERQDSSEVETSRASNADI